MTEENHQAKKTKSPKDQEALAGTPGASRIFQPFRVIGHVTSAVPFSLLDRRSAFYITTAVDRSFHIYDCQHLKLLFVGPVLSEPITALASHRDYTIVGSAQSVTICERARKVASIPVGAAVLQVAVLGDFFAVLTEANVLRVYSIQSHGLTSEISFDAGFTATSFLHPHTYVNKLLVASKEGRLRIVNISTKRLIYETQGFGSPITCISQTPVVDIIAVGLLDGTVLLHNIRTDETLFKLVQQAQVTAISLMFADNPVMATGSSSGDILIWNLEERKLEHVFRGAHDGPVIGLAFVPGQPLLVSSGTDNAIKEWILDDLSPRLLCYRSGHHEPPQIVRYYGEEGKGILSASRDKSLRFFSTTRDAQNVELSPGNVSKKAAALRISLDEAKPAPIVSFASETIREKDWDNLVTCHKNSNFALTWKVLDRTIGSHKLASIDGSNITSCAMSQCGNFVLLGCLSGRIDIFNVQSGIYRKALVGHEKEVTGVYVHSENKVAVSASLDSTIRFWSFSRAKELDCVRLPSKPSMMVGSKGDLLAVACDNLDVVIIDMDTRKIIREYQPHINRVTDLTFSADNRWLVTSSLDMTIKVYDIPTGKLVDELLCGSVPLSAALSPIGDFLAVSFVDSVGIHLLFNKTQFNVIPLLPIEEDEDSNAALVWNQEYHGQDGFVHLSDSSRVKWTNLFHLDNIKKRNKPVAPPKAPERAPFFLTASLLGPAPAKETKSEPGGSLNKSDGSLIKPDLQFADLLKHSQSTNQFSDLVDHMEKMSSSSLDLEIRSLQATDDFADLLAFLRLIDAMFESKMGFDMAIAYLNLFVKIHADPIRENPAAFRQILSTIRDKCQSLWNRLEPKFQTTLCLVNFFQELS